jgi:hypothetical protein
MSQGKLTTPFIDHITIECEGMRSYHSWMDSWDITRSLFGN